MIERPRFFWFGIAERILLLRRLALYLHAGISLPHACGMMLDDTSSPSARYVLITCEHIVLRGEPLSRALAQFPRQFDSFAIGFIEASEASGALPSTLVRLADIIEKQRVLRERILGALLYPAIVVLSTLAIALFLTLGIFPKILPILRSLKTDLPFSTRLLLSISSFLSHDWFLVCGFLLLLSVCATIAWRYASVRRLSERILLRIPILGKLYQLYVLTAFLSVFSTLLAGGVRIISALVLTQKILPGILYPAALISIENSVARGERLSVSLQHYPELFPSPLPQMIAAGEQTGTLRENTTSLQVVFEHSLDELADRLTILIEPLLMLLMGVFVGFIALAIITPIYRLTQGITIH